MSNVSFTYCHIFEKREIEKGVIIHKKEGLNPLGNYAIIS